MKCFMKSEDNISKQDPIDPIIVVCGVDNKYVMPLSVVIASALKNLNSEHEIIFYIIDGGIRPNNKKKLQKLFVQKNSSLKFIQAPLNIIENLKESGHFSRAAYLRLLIPDLLPNQYNKAIYLDSDLIVKGNLGDLWNINIGDNYLLAVPSLGIPYVSSNYGLSNYQKLGISAKSKYFNSGVLVINLEKWRNNNISQKIINYIEQNEEITLWADQDGMNALLAGKWGELPAKWNKTPEFNNYLEKDNPFSEQDFQNALHQPCIVHFASSVKPWNSTFKYPENDSFFDYLDTTPWSGWRFTAGRQFIHKLEKKIKQLKSWLTTKKTVKQKSGVAIHNS
jgi:lipopolysaccharide biosynthesis glycosyltransferase